MQVVEDPQRNQCILGVEFFFCRPEGVGTLSLLESKGGEVFLPPPMSGRSALTRCQSSKIFRISSQVYFLPVTVLAIKKGDARSINVALTLATLAHAASLSNVVAVAY